MNDDNIFLHDMISEKVITDLNVLCLRALDWVVGHFDGTFIVVVEWHMLQVDTIVLESLLHHYKKYVNL